MDSTNVSNTGRKKDILMLPTDVIRIICTFLGPKECVSLMLTCRTLMIALNFDLLTWRSIMSKLCIPFNEDIFEPNQNDGFFCLEFQRFINIRRSLIHYKEERTYQHSHRIHYDIGYGSQEKDSFQQNKKKSKPDYKMIENLIIHSTIVYDYDESYFVIIQSKDRNDFWADYMKQTGSRKPTHSRIHVYNIKFGACRYVGCQDFSFEVAAQDIKVYNGMLLLLPIKDPDLDDNPTELLLIYAIKENSSYSVLDLKKSYCIPQQSENGEKCRLAPHVYKESGEKRVYILPQEGRDTNCIDILLIVPCPIWTITILRFTPNNDKLWVVKEVQITEACSDVVGQLFTADQKGTTLAVALYTKATSRLRFKSVVAVIDFNVPPYGPPDECGSINEITPQIDLLNGDMGPSFLDNAFNLYGSVQDMRLYYVSATNYYDTPNHECMVHRNKRKPGRPQGYYAPILVFLLASDKLVLYSSHRSNEECLNLEILFGKNNRFLSKNWHHSEIQVSDKVLFKSRKREVFQICIKCTLELLIHNQFGLISFQFILFYI